MSIKVIINGAAGKMGRVTKDSMAAEKDLQLVASLGQDDDLSQQIKSTQADVVIDFTTPQAVFHNAETIIRSSARAVIGTSGLNNKQIAELKAVCETKKLGMIIAPNFSLGAVLMMRYAKDAAQYFPDVEIIETHHPQKLDAPSGTAVKTAQLIAENKNPSQTSAAKVTQDIARGDHSHQVPIHSLRLPGFFSQQSVIFSSQGEVLTIRHDGLDRKACMPGVFLACRQVMALNHLIYGLENIL